MLDADREHLGTKPRPTLLPTSSPATSEGDESDDLTLPLPSSYRLDPLPNSPKPSLAKEPHLGWLSLVGVTFFAVCGGDYGLEDAVGAGGPSLTLAALLLVPWIWSLPIALMTAELGAMIPETGGYIVWVHRAFGPFWAHQNAARMVKVTTVHFAVHVPTKTCVVGALGAAAAAANAQRTLHPHEKL